jgi:hypothetical protein
MINLTLIICTMISFLIFLMVVVKPLFWDQDSPLFLEEETKGAFNDSLSLLETIKELEIDYKMGKLSKEDFETLSLEYKRKYLEHK